MPPGILLINYHFPPLYAVGALRNHHVASQFAERGYRVHVLSSANRNRGKPQVLPHHDGITVHDIPTLDYRTLREWLPAGVGGRLPARKDSPILRFLRRVKETAPFSLLLDEGGPMYILTALLRASSIVKRNHLDYVYSSYRPRADHLVAHHLCHLHPHLRWLADFRDPHVDANRNNVFFPHLQQILDRRLVSNAEAVCTVSSGIARQLRTIHPKVRVLTNGIAAWQKKSWGGPDLPSNTFLITYTGSLYPEYQNPHPLFSALRSMLIKDPHLERDLRLVYAGPHSQIWSTWVKQHQLQSIHLDPGPLPITQSLGLQQSSHLNVLLNWAGPVFSGILTGKLYEYLASGTPLLAIVNGPLSDPELEDIIRQTGGGKVVYTRQAPEMPIQDFIFHLLKKWRQNKPVARPEIPKTFQWQYMLGNFLQEIEWP